MEEPTSPTRPQCTTCFRSGHPSALPLLCPVDARQTLYPTRLSLTTLQMQNANLQSQINTLQSTPLTLTALSSLRASTSLCAVRAETVRAAVDKLQGEISQERKYIAERREVIRKRRAELESAGCGLESRRLGKMESVMEEVADSNKTATKVTTELLRTRRFLLEEVGRLFGPVVVAREDSGKPIWEIGGVRYIDIMNMHNYPPEQISVCLTHTAHLLHRAATYLSVRLPSELTLPHKDHPRPTIYTIAHSYRTPGSMTPVHLPLYLLKPLPVLAKEDPSVFHAFLEAVAHLCYDVAWLCLSQGITFSERISLDDITALPALLYLLLFNKHPFTPNPRYLPGTPNPSTSKQRLSHGAARLFPNKKNGIDTYRLSRLPVPATISEKMTMKIVTDLAMPEWEVLDTREWAMEERESDAVLITAVKRGDEPAQEEQDGKKESPWKKVRMRLVG